MHSTNKQIPFHLPHKAENEERYILDALQRQSRFGGKYSKLCRDALRELCPESEVYLTNSCTAALELAAMGLNLGPGDEVIIPSFTFAATATAFARTGAKIVLCDVNAQTMMLDCESVAERITPKTKAIVPVHYGGSVANLNEIREICKNRDIKIIEDSAQALGAYRGEQTTNSIGSIKAYSFHETKIAHCGHGGALVITGDNHEFRRRISVAINRGTNFLQFQDGLVSHYEWTGAGGSFQPTELQAAQLYAQLEDLSVIISKRQKLLEYYKANLEHILEIEEDVTPNGHAAIFISQSSEHTSLLIKKGSEIGIQLSSHYKPLHLSEMGRKLGYEPKDLPICTQMWRRIVRLPIHTKMSEQDAERVVSLVREYSS